MYCSTTFTIRIVAPEMNPHLFALRTRLAGRKQTCFPTISDNSSEYIHVKLDPSCRPDGDMVLSFTTESYEETVAVDTIVNEWYESLVNGPTPTTDNSDFALISLDSDIRSTSGIADDPVYNRDYGATRARRSSSKLGATTEIEGPVDPVQLLSHVDVERFARALGRTFSSLDDVLVFAREHSVAIINLGVALTRGTR